MKLTASASLIALLLICSSSVSLADTITAVCHEPRGPRIDFIEGKVDEISDGFSNSNPTFYFSSKDPEYLIESWQAALPFPEMIKRDRVDEIVPPSVSKSHVLFRSPSVIHAMAKRGREAYTTTLYVHDGFAIFSRIRVEMGGLIGWPMGALYTAKCKINVLP